MVPAGSASRNPVQSSEWIHSKSGVGGGGGGGEIFQKVITLTVL